ncbi:PLP-dependent aminotransferase family protein [Solihabitans fulvus]|uniref:PLP-dependent aminotransferase family protein n=1 Tax=Solihabitans fulvus TaxID=1892852 RepID=A0A5B2XJ19_9PSEU|nr:PLP-dependent aminotransferase family protein [Solihabitans fulvus]KAA2263224.1 PLP-dependent aminotransferase family protein [Solihabitans fulvus]
MTGEWTTFRELLLPAIAEVPAGRRGRAVEAALRSAVREGRLAPGGRLPSSRDLAGQLGLARGTVTAAYAQLVAEGHLTARHGSGTRVAESVGHAAGPRRPAEDGPPKWRFDLRPGLPALGAFPRADWLAATRAGLAALSDEELGYPDPAGLSALRAELADYLGRVRAVAADPAEVLVTNGVAESLALTAGVLAAEGHRTIAVEDPHHEGQDELLDAHGLRAVPVPVDDEGIRVDLLSRTECRAVLVTSAHQFPLGVVLSPRRRHALVAWAAERDGYVLEDDYDAEHRYDRPALGAVQGLAPDRVIYHGSVSKVLAPALRIGWLVAPRALHPLVVRRKRLTDLGCSPLPQVALAHLLRTGGYDRHLRRTRALYRRRRDALLDALATALPSWQPVGVAAGLHVVLRLPAGTDDVALQDALAARGVHAPALSGYRIRPDLGSPSNTLFPGLVLGYASMSPDRLRAAVTEIAAAAAAC